MDSRTLRYFVAIVDHGGFGRAAKHLHVSQSALSQAIRSLERECDAPLFHRVGRGVVLSDAGQALLPAARNVVIGLQIAEESAAELRGLAAGSVNVSVTPWLSVDPLTPLIGAFLRERPQLAVKVMARDDSDLVIDALLHGTAEIGLINGPAEHAGLDEHLISSSRLLIVLPPGVEPPGETCTLDDVAHIPFIGTPVGTMARGVLEEAIARGVPIRIVVDSPHRQAVIPLLLEEIGAAVLPLAVARRAAAQGARVIELSPTVRFPINLIHRAGPLAPVAREFVRISIETATTMHRAAPDTDDRAETSSTRTLATKQEVG